MNPVRLKRSPRSAYVFTPASRLRLDNQIDAWFFYHYAGAMINYSFWRAWDYALVPEALKAMDGHENKT